MSQRASIQGAAGAPLQNVYLEFLLAHIEPLFATDTNADIGSTFVALAYPYIFIVGPPLDYNRCIVDVRQPGFNVDPDCYPLKRFLEQFPHVCQKVVEEHTDLLFSFLQWKEG